MSIQNDISFLKKLSLENFKQIDKDKFNFRCPICSDSRKSKFKARGYAIPHKSKDSLFIYCHNCDYRNQFYFFIKELKERGNIDSIFYNAYVFNGIKDKNEECDEFIIEERKEKIINENRYLINVGKFKDESIVQKYLRMRCIDKNFFNEIYFSLNFKKLINNYYLRKYVKENDSPRIVFPILESEKLIGFQGRSIYNNSYRYMNIKFDENSNFIYKQKNINKSEIIFITEGVFDCLMLKNSIAMLGSNLTENVLNEYKGCKVIFIYDNEKRNFQIIQKYKKIIEKNGIGLFVWPYNVKYKDVNEWVMREKNKEKIEKIILKNSYFNKIEKYLHFSKWI